MRPMGIQEAEEGKSRPEDYNKNLINRTRDTTIKKQKKQNCISLDNLITFEAAVTLIVEWDAQ